MAYKKLTLSPESLVYTGDYVNEPLSIEVYASKDGDLDIQNFDRSQLNKALKILARSPNRAWVNIVGLNDIEAIAEIGKALQMDPLFVEDILNVQQRSKYEEGQKYVFMTMKMLMKQGFVTRKKRRVDSLEIQQEHISMIIKDNLIVTFQENPEDVFASIRDAFSKGGHILSRGVDYWAYLMMDAIVDHQLALMADMADLLDGFETALLDTKRLDLEGLYILRKSLLKIKRASYPLKDIFAMCINVNNPAFSSETITYLHDVDDHLNHVIEQHEHYRDIIANLFEMHATEASNRMNRIMTTLTVFSAVFIPLNFLAGFFGMNFKHFAMLDAPSGIPLFIVGSGRLSVILVLIFKRIKW